MKQLPSPSAQRLTIGWVLGKVSGIEFQLAPSHWKIPLVPQIQMSLALSTWMSDKLDAPLS